MKIGVAGPISLGMLEAEFPGQDLPEGYRFAPMAKWVCELLRRGHQVVVFTHAPGGVDSRSYSNHRLTVHVVPQRPSGRGRDFFAQERRALREFISAERCDVVHAHWTYEFALAALDSGTPTLVTAHDAPVAIFRLMPNAYRFARLLMAFNVAHRTRNLTAVSPYIARHFKRYLMYRNPISIVPNAIASEVFDLASTRKSEPHRSFTIATVLTGWTGRKNGPMALKAFRLFREHCPEARLLMLGEDYKAGGAANRWAAANSLHFGVEFVGHCPYDSLMCRLARDVDVLLHPALEESFGMTVAEAMALGISVIAGRDSGAVPWLLDGGVAGVLVDVRSPIAIAKALIDLASDRPRRIQLVNAAQESASRRFRPEVVFDLYEAEYQRLLD